MARRRRHFAGTWHGKKFAPIGQRGTCATNTYKGKGPLGSKHCYCVSRKGGVRQVKSAYCKGEQACRTKPFMTGRGCMCQTKGGNLKHVKSGSCRGKKIMYPHRKVKRGRR